MRGVQSGVAVIKHLCLGKVRVGDAMRMIMAMILVGCVGTATVAQPLGERAATAELIDTSGIGLQLSRALTEKEGATIKTLIPLIEQQTGTKAKFYGALAYAPDEGLISNALQGAFNYHSVEAADAAALAACSAAKTGAGACSIAARILPPGYQRRAISLSLDATQAFFDKYRPATGNKYFAISRSTGAWALGPSEGGALSACTRDARGANDCAILVKD